MLLVVSGSLRDEVPDREELVRPGEFLIEPKATLNTGNIVNERTVAELERM